MARRSGVVSGITFEVRSGDYAFVARAKHDETGARRLLNDYLKKQTQYLRLIYAFES
jgi:hypothetical protein